MNIFYCRRQNQNLRIFHAAGQDFIMQQEEGCRNYDLIIVDAFDNDGPAADLSEKPFLAACRQRLKEDGICSFNLWSRPKDNFPALYTAIEEAFEGSTLKLLPDEACWNAVVFGFTGRCCLRTWLVTARWPGPCKRPMTSTLQNI